MYTLLLFSLRSFVWFFRTRINCLIVYSIRRYTLTLKKKKKNMWYRQQQFLLRFLCSFCLLFILRNFIDNYYRYDIIKQALEQMPNCSSTDRRRQRILLDLLQSWSHFAEQYNIQYCLTYGSLVGYVQRHGLLPHDADLDILIPNEQMPKLMTISQTNFSSIYELKVQPQWFIVDYRKRSYFRNQTINFIVPNARYRRKINRYHIDLFPIYDFSSSESNQSQNKNLTIHNRYSKQLSVPQTWIYPIEICYFSGIKTRCPANAKKLVSTLYGVSALIKSDKKCKNGTWIRA